MDQDGDGNVSRAEFVAKTDRMFERLDENADGTLTKAELEAARGPSGQILVCVKFLN